MPAFTLQQMKELNGPLKQPLPGTTFQEKLDRVALLCARDRANSTRNALRGVWLVWSGAEMQGPDEPVWRLLHRIIFQPSKLLEQYLDRPTLQMVDAQASCLEKPPLTGDRPER